MIGSREMRPSLPHGLRAFYRFTGTSLQRYGFGSFSTRHA